jgi:Raf kinase inhibitor-like YbhB/YbcL family protein
MKLVRVLLFVLAALAIGAVSINPRPLAGVSVTLSSNAFIDRSPIPAAYTCDGDGRSPELEWTWIPDNARSLVLVVDDFSTFEHDKSILWSVWNIDPKTRELHAGSSGGGVEGMNDFQRIGYAAPCPPRGEMHLYGFRLFGLDTMLSLDPQKTTGAELERAMDMHVVAGGTLIGSYTRPYE